MTYVFDACIVVAAMKPSEPLHAACRRRVDLVLAGDTSLVVPALFIAEVASALTRTTTLGAARIQAFVDELMTHTTVVTIGPTRARLIAGVASRTRLRSGDATYVWVAARQGLVLVTADEEICSRASDACAIERP